MRKTKLIVLTMILAIALSVSMGLQAEAAETTLHSWDTKIDDAGKRFEVLADFNNEAVLDKETGLVWERSPDTELSTWFGAFLHCYDREVGGRKGWRLPTVEELTSLVDTTESFPALPSGHPFSNIIHDGQAYYWTATSDATGANDAWDVNLNGGAVSGVSNGADHAWCVRGGR